jgi:hypothetical protein
MAANTYLLASMGSWQSGGARGVREEEAVGENGETVTTHVPFEEPAVETWFCDFRDAEGNSHKIEFAQDVFTEVQHYQVGEYYTVEVQDEGGKVAAIPEQSVALDLKMAIDAPFDVPIDVTPVDGIVDPGLPAKG